MRPSVDQVDQVDPGVERVRLHRDFLLGVSFRTFGGRCWEYVRCGEETIVKNTPWPVTDVMELGAMWG